MAFYDNRSRRAEQMMFTRKIKVSRDGGSSVWDADFQTD